MKEPITAAIDFFPEHELACKGTGVIKLNPDFAEALVKLRTEYGRPLSPTSVCRTPEHNTKVGGHPRSLHLTENPVHNTNGTCAIDIAWRTWSTERKLEFAQLAYKRGWSVGLHDGFIHLDWRQVAGLPQACFLYGTWSNDFTISDVRDSE